MTLCEHAFTPEQKAATRAVMAAEVSQTELAYDYAGEASPIDGEGVQFRSGRSGLGQATFAVCKE